MPGRNTRMQQWINYRVRVTIMEKRVLVGTFMAFDRHMNVVLADCEEFRKIRQKGSSEEKEVKRWLGFVLLRGENIVSLSAEAPPSAAVKKQAQAQENLVLGPGKAQPAGRGQVGGGGVMVGGVAMSGAAGGIGGPPMMMPPPIGLAGPVRGVGGPAPQQMIPQHGQALGSAASSAPAGMMPPPGAGGGGMRMMVPPSSIPSAGGGAGGVMGPGGGPMPQGMRPPPGMPGGMPPPPHGMLMRPPQHPPMK